jgi:hypothetical protein
MPAAPNQPTAPAPPTAPAAPMPPVAGPAPVVPRAPAPSASGEYEPLDEHPHEHESFRAILSSYQRAGRWEAADDIEVRAICGELTLDFTHADLPPSGEVEIEALAIGGEITIIVPDGAEVEVEGTPFVGSISQEARKKGAREWIREKVMGDVDPAPPPTLEPPFFRIDARAIFGVVKVIGR